MPVRRHLRDVSCVWRWLSDAEKWEHVMGTASKARARKLQRIVMCCEVFISISVS